MPTLIIDFNWGMALRNSNPELTRQLSQAYNATALVVNTKVSRVAVDGSDPPANDQFNRNYEIGDIYVRTDTDTAWIMTSRTTSNAVTWTQIT